MATPEVLLEGNGRQWRTMSLAGTMKLDDKQLDFDEPPTPQPTDSHDILWSIKNIQEQRFVSTFITESLEQVAGDIEEKGPFTMRAGNLVHLRSDFLFTMEQADDIGKLLAILYPTPAVCGLPKDSARDFILRNEFAPRQYYSGFAGPMATQDDTHLYVSLRCMRIDASGCFLYAGGGIMADSEQEAEWKETEDKMGTMRAVLQSP
jgi:isochorismate synthase